jgi:clathrin heavy chain
MALKVMRPRRVADRDSLRTGLYYYLGSVVSLSEDLEVHFKYIKAAARTGQIREVERIQSQKGQELPQRSQALRPTSSHHCLRSIRFRPRLRPLSLSKRTHQIHVQRVNSVRTTQVIGGLLDVDCDETTIKGLLASVTGNFPIDELVHQVEERNRLKLISPWLEARVESGSRDPAVFNAMAKIYIDSNNNPEAFLKENNVSASPSSCEQILMSLKLYEPLVVQEFCEVRDP